MKKYLFLHRAYALYENKCLYSYLKNLKPLFYNKQFRFNLTAHRQLYNWLFLHPKKDILSWPGWKKFNRKIYRANFACDYARSIASELKIYQFCKFCPFRFRSKSGNTNCLGGLKIKFAWHSSNIYRKVGNTEFDIKRIKCISRAIRDFPVKADIPII